MVRQSRERTGQMFFAAREGPPAGDSKEASGASVGGAMEVTMCDRLVTGPSLRLGVCSSLGTFLALASTLGCIGPPATAAQQPVGVTRGAVLGTDTFLYLRCNATSWDVNDRSRFVETAPGSCIFTVSYDVAVDWLVQSPDSCGLLETNQLNGFGTVQTPYAFRSGQAPLVVVPDARALVAASSSNFQIRYPFKGRYTATVNWHNGTFVVGATVLPQRSLFERNEAALTGFTMSQALNSIATNGNVAGGVAWHDSIFKAMSRQFQFPDDPGPFCDSGGVGVSLINGFPVSCPSNGAPAFGQVDFWEGLAVANRFDLAPTGGENCGEARASFYLPPDRPATLPARAFMIIEATVANPHPDQGLEGCRALSAFWAGLSVVADPAARGAKLAQAYLTGEPTLTAAGFKPFFTFENFGPGKGRVRTLAFGGNINLWDFREFRLRVGGGVDIVPVAQSLTTTMFSIDSSGIENPKAAGCRDNLLAGLATLIPANPNFMGVDISSDCFDGESTNFQARFEDAIQDPSRATFASALVARAQQIFAGANLTATQIAARAEFSGTCIGCHFRPDTTASRDLGQGLTLPVVPTSDADPVDNVAFTQVNNLRQEPCATSGPDAGQQCFKLSPVLSGIFLPARVGVLENYLHTPLGTFHPNPGGARSALNIGGAPNSHVN